MSEGLAGVSDEKTGTNKTRPTLVEFLTARLDEDEAQAGRWAFEGATLFGETEYESLSARVLAEVEAKRGIVELMSDEVEYIVNSDDVLLLLASVYADHPDYQQEWKP
jgi:hypothetical protein